MGAAADVADEVLAAAAVADEVLAAAAAAAAAAVVADEVVAAAAAAAAAAAVVADEVLAAAAAAGFLAKGAVAAAAAGLFMAAAFAEVGGERLATRDLNCSFFFGLRSSLVHLPCTYSSARALMMRRPAFTASSLVAWYMLCSIQWVAMMYKLHSCMPAAPTHIVIQCRTMLASTGACCSPQARSPPCLTRPSWGVFLHMDFAGWLNPSKQTPVQPMHNKRVWLAT